MKRLRHPIRAIREPFGTAGLIVACVALIAALAGGAYAASALTGKQKKEVEKIAKKFAGKPGAPGAAGPQGPAGPAGANGKDGQNGTNGSNGTDGVSVTSTALAEGNEDCEFGGSEFDAANGTTFACNGEPGEEGSPWTAGGTLPPGETQTGTWAFGKTSAAAKVNVPISFPIPLADQLGSTPESEEDVVNWPVHFIKANGQEFGLNGSFEPVERTSTACLGSVGNPTAKPGHLCVYAKQLTNTTTPTGFEFFPAGDNAGEVAVSVTGGYFEFSATAVNGSGYGSWAVTAPEA